MLSLLATIWFLHFIMMVTPGVNMLLITQLAAGGQRNSAMWASLGVALGAAMWACLAVLGVKAVFEMVPGLRLGLQVGGSLYLMYIATKLWRSGLGAPGQVATELTPGAAFRRGLLTNATNPKSALFFSSVFVAVLPGNPNLALQISAVLLIGLNAVVWHLFLSFAFSRASVRQGYAKHRARLNKTVGSLVGLLGARLLAGTMLEGK
jgi:threonine efflux protein